MANDHKRSVACGQSRIPLAAELCEMPVEEVKMYLAPGNHPFNRQQTQRAILAGASLWSNEPIPDRKRIR